MAPLAELTVEQIDRNLAALSEIHRTLQPGPQRLVLSIRIDRLLDQRHTLTTTTPTK